jgi:hypothetical protein
MIEVFKTSVREQVQADIILSALINLFPSIRSNFDLDDCDHVLRVEGNDFTAIQIISFLNCSGYHCEVLD